MPELNIETLNAESVRAAALYVGLNLLILLTLAINVVRQRIATKTMIGDGGHDKMVAASRAHANGAEYTPGFLIGLVLAAVMGIPALYIHVLGGAFTLARAGHAYGLASSTGSSPGRFYGTLITMVAYLLLGLGLIVHAFI